MTSLWVATGLGLLGVCLLMVLSPVCAIIVVRYLVISYVGTMLTSTNTGRIGHQVCCNSSHRRHTATKRSIVVTAHHRIASTKTPFLEKLKELDQKKAEREKLAATLEVVKQVGSDLTKAEESFSQIFTGLDAFASIWATVSSSPQNNISLRRFNGTPTDSLRHKLCLWTPQSR